MDSFELNKIAGAVLFAALVILGVKELGGAFYATHPPAKQAYVVEGVEQAAAPAAAAGAPAEADPPIAELLKAASAENGQKVAKACLSCHAVEKGGANKVGPYLWGTVGSVIGTHAAGFNYSAAVKGKGADGTTWTFDHLYEYLKDPKGYIPGNKMAFAGVKKPKDRADLIAYLATLSDNPVPVK